MLLNWVVVSLGWAPALPNIFLIGVARGLGLVWFSKLLGCVAVLVMLVAVGARGLGSVFRAFGMSVRVAGLRARVAKVFFDWGARGLGSVFNGAGLGRCGVDARG